LAVLPAVKGKGRRVEEKSIGWENGTVLIIEPDHWDDTEGEDPDRDRPHPRLPILLRTKSKEETEGRPSRKVRCQSPFDGKEEKGRFKRN